MGNRQGALGWQMAIRWTLSVPAREGSLHKLALGLVGRPNAQVSTTLGLPTPPR